MAKRRNKAPAHRREKKRSRSRWTWIAGLLLAMSAALAVYVVYLDAEVRTQFEGKRWALPAQVYARPLELYAEQAMSADQFTHELRTLGYREESRPKEPGTYARLGGAFVVVTRPFRFWDEDEPSRFLRLEFSGQRLLGLWRADDGTAVDLLRLDPPLIGRIYPRQKEDRVLVKLAEVPPLLIDTLLAVEDHGFYEHHGIAPLSILRALWVNLRAGQTVQGGSTLTQQLVKNFFLSNERTLTRKFTEAIMALLLEYHYGKNEILEAYLNEIYLGQDGQRAIHGFGLASQFYFERPLSELRPEQVALLVALVKGPSYYDPRRYPRRALERRNLVLRVMRDAGISAPQTVADSAPLGVTPRAQSGVTQVPAFMDLVRRQLQSDYSDGDLRSDGLRIFTTLDPRVQRETEQAVSKQLQRLDNADGALQGAAVVVNVDDGEVLAVVGGRDPRFAGFNRALDAQRPIGSLIKPAVYLTALKRGYTLATLLDDGPLSLTQNNGEVWEPQNFDHESHGVACTSPQQAPDSSDDASATDNEKCWQVPLFQALAQSYNLSTARLGLSLGLPTVIDTLKDLGVKQQIAAYPALLLGAVNLSPLTVAQMYHTLAAGGFRTPLRAIRAVLTADGRPLQRYPLSVERTVDGTPVFLINAALEETARHGTGRSLYQQLPQDLVVAGKTGSSDDLRDSWFAGFSANRLAAVWVGRDDNQSTGLTGAGGALRVWGDIMSDADVHSRDDVAPPGVEWVWVNTHTGLRVDEDCASARRLPFIEDTAPREWAKCVDNEN